MFNIWHFNSNGLNNLYVKNIVTLRTFDIYKQNWHEMTSTHAYCDFYDTIKSEMKIEKYIIDLSQPEGCNVYIQMQK